MEVNLLNTNINSFLIEHPSFTTADFTDMVKTQSPDIGRSTIFFLLKSLCEAGVIIRTGRGHFGIPDKKNYEYELSETSKIFLPLFRKGIRLLIFKFGNYIK